MTVFTHTPSGFLTMRRILYSASQETADNKFSHRFSRHAGKLKGHHEWAFSFVLPKGVSILSQIDKEGLERKKFRLPPSVSDDINGVYVQYYLEISVERSRFRPGRRYVCSCIKS